jgi:hypothetical protein
LGKEKFMEINIERVKKVEKWITSQGTPHTEPEARFVEIINECITFVKENIDNHDLVATKETVMIEHVFSHVSWRDYSISEIIYPVIYKIVEYGVEEIELESPLSWWEKLVAMSA